MPRKRALSAPESQARPSLSGTAFVSLPRKSEPGDSLAAARETCGAGTTTPVSRLVGLLKPDAGSIRVAGVYAVGRGLSGGVSRLTASQVGPLITVVAAYGAEARSRPLPAARSRRRCWSHGPCHGQPEIAPRMSAAGRHTEAPQETELG